MRSQRPVPDSYREVISGPARASEDAWERRRWWSRAIAAAAAFLLGGLLLQLAARGGLPGATSLASGPVFLFDPAALALGAAILWLMRDRWPVRPAAVQLDAWLDRIVR
jgi:hypothetical protein